MESQRQQQQRQAALSWLTFDRSLARGCEIRMEQRARATGETGLMRQNELEGARASQPQVGSS